MALNGVHPTAIIEDGAQIDPTAQIGPFCHIGAQVKIGAGCVLKSHVVVAGDTQIGAETVIFPFAVIGEIPQDLKYAGETTRLEIGARNRIREYVTINTGTEGGGGITRIGNDGLFMACCHIAHDCMIGDRVVLVNSVAIAGHCQIDDDVIVGGLSGVHQFVRIGRGAMIGAVTMVTKDVIPYGLVQGPRGVLDGLNLVGLKRRGVDRDDINELRAAFQRLSQQDGTFLERIAVLQGEAKGDHLRHMLEFVTADSDRSFLTPG